MDFNKIVNKLGKKGGKIIFKKDIFDLIDPDLQEKNTRKLDKCVYRLLSTGVIISIKAGVYIIPDQEDKKLNEIDLLEKYFIKLLKRYITENVGGQYYISGEKSLQVHLKDFSVPDKIYIITKHENKKIQLGEKEIIFKTISGNYNGKKINLFSKFSYYTKKISFDGIDFKFSCIELALLESALLGDMYQGINMDLLIKAIKKYHHVFERDIFYEVGKYKYNMSYNRLKEISKTLDRDLYQVFLDVIKKNGNCFVGEGMRGI